MNLSNRSVVLIAILMLFIILLPAIAGLANGAGGDDFPDEYYLQDGGFMSAWVKMQNPQLSSGLMLGMSVFVLIVVYQGGRSNHRRFNDRTIDSVNLLGVFFFMTALLRAVFVSLRSAPASRLSERRIFR